MKKILSILMIAIISTMMLIAGGTKEETAKTTETGEEKITLGLYWWGNQLRNDQTKQVADLYLKMHPNIEIKMEFVDFNNYWDKLSALATLIFQIYQTVSLKADASMASAMHYHLVQMHLVWSMIPKL